MTRLFGRLSCFLRDDVWLDLDMTVDSVPVDWVARDAAEPVSAELTALEPSSDMIVDNS